MAHDPQMLAFEDHMCRHFQNIQRQLTRIEMRLLRSGVTEEQVKEITDSLRGVRQNLQSDVAKSKKA